MHPSSNHRYLLLAFRIFRPLPPLVDLPPPLPILNPPPPPGAAAFVDPKPIGACVGGGAIPPGAPKVLNDGACLTGAAAEAPPPKVKLLELTGAVGCCPKVIAGAAGAWPNPGVAGTGVWPNADVGGAPKDGAAGVAAPNDGAVGAD